MWPAMVSFCLPVCAVGGLAHYNLDMGGKMAATGRVARKWEEGDSMLSSD
jgi:hypothetical protein